MVMTGKGQNEMDQATGAATLECVQLESGMTDWRSLIQRASLDQLRALRFLHRAQVGGASKVEESMSKVQSLDPDGELRRAAIDVGLCQNDNEENPTLTSLGRSIGDGVKQYVNWCEHKSELPRGMREEWITGKAVLDVGCGVGCAMLTFARHEPERLAGADLLETFLNLAGVFALREGYAVPERVLSNGARLPFDSNSFDTLFCRLALNYMPSHLALREMSRILRPGGTLVVIVNTIGWDLRIFRDNLMACRVRTCMFDLLKLVNGSILWLTGRQMTVRFKGRMHSIHSPVFFTPAMLRRQFRRFGLTPQEDDSRTMPLTPYFVARKKA